MFLTFRLENGTGCHRHTKAFDQRIKHEIKRLRKALKERTVAHTMSAMFAGIEIRAEGDLCNAEEGIG